MGGSPLRDRDSRTTGFRVSFFNATTGREVDIVTRMEALPNDAYHAHPHPQFCRDDTCIAYTTTVRGTADVAFAEVAELVTATGG